jgi:hypothetical protein
MRWLLLLFVSAAWADIEPGNWEITVATEAQGMAEPMTFTRARCLAPEDARDPSRLFGASPGMGCEFVNRNDTGTGFTFEVACSSPQSIRGSGSVRYNRDSVDGELELRVENFATRSRISARRLGDCR